MLLLILHSMPPAALHLSLAPLITALTDDIRRSIGLAAEAGFRHVQLSATQRGLRPRDLDQSARRDLLAVLRRHELSLAGLDLWIPAEHFIHDAHVSRAVDATAAAISLSADLGRVPLSMNLPVAEKDSSDETVAPLLDEISAIALRQGVPIADHTVPPQPSANEAVGLGIDPPAFLAQGLDPSAAVAAHADKLVSARLGDLNASGMRCAPGEANARLDITGYKIALSVAGYQRPVVIDARQWAQPWAGMLRCAEVWANCVNVS